MAVHLPTGYRGVTFSELLKHFDQLLGDMLFEHIGVIGLKATAAIQDLEHKGLVQFAISPGGDPSVFLAPAKQFASHDDFVFATKLVTFWDVQGEYSAHEGQVTLHQPALPPHKLPHWQEALDRRMQAIESLKFIEKLPRDHKFASQINWMDINDDLQALKAAETYSFSADTMHAIRTGAQSIPHESTLKSLELPQVRAGWFWFAESIPLASSPMASENTAGLLWSWDNSNHPALRFSAYVVDEKRMGTVDKILPSTKWLWPVDLTFHEMLALNTQLYRQAYGPGGPYSGQPHLIGEKPTMLAVAELSLFFMMSCLWFKQTVPGSKPKLTQTDGHIERHAKKRYQKELKLEAPPRVRVIALRKTAAEPVEQSPLEEGKSHLTVRFVVKGHARLQPCGPGRVDRKLIWIDPFMKGPDDAPFKESGPKVYAVVR